MISGQSAIPCVVNYLNTNNAGKVKESKTISIDYPESFSKDDRKEEIAKSIPDLDGWKIWDDGTGTQQYSKKWAVLLYRYVERTGE